MLEESRGAMEEAQLCGRKRHSHPASLSALEGPNTTNATRNHLRWNKDDYLNTY